MKIILNFLIFSFFFVVLSEKILDFKSTNLVYRKTGNISITGIFNIPECEATATGRGLQEMASAIWATEALNNYHYVSGINIGLSLYSFCGELNANSLLEILEEESIHCEGVNIGILTPTEIYKKIELLMKIQSKRLAPIEHFIKVDLLVDLTVQLLTNLQWMIVDAVVADSENVLNLFRKRISDEGISIRDELLINNSLLLENAVYKNKSSSLIVVITEFANMQKILSGVQHQKRLILVPRDFIFDEYLDLPKNTIVFMPSMNEKNTLRQYIKNKKYHNDIFNHKEPTKSPLFIGVAAAILKLLQPLKDLEDEKCRNSSNVLKQPCREVAFLMNNLEENKTFSLPQTSIGISFDDIAKALQALKIDFTANDEIFLYITSLINGNQSEDFAIFQIFSLKAKTFRPILLKINDNLLDERIERSGAKFEREKQTFGFDLGKDKEFSETNSNSKPLIKLLQSLTNPSEGNLKRAAEQANTSDINDFDESCDFQNHTNHTCRHFKGNDTQFSHGTHQVWRLLTWVSINTCVGFMGVVSTLSIMSFIISRICKGDILEGSPYFTLLLIFAVILTFSSSLPFHINVTGNSFLLCSFRINGPPLAYSILFSLLFSRSLMLAAASGNDGFVSHINGYLQSILCFFMISVQVSLLLQNRTHEFGFALNCSHVHDEQKVMISFGYNFFLLGLLVCVSPFIIRSKRNYHEGLLFSISVFFIILAWSAWISLYFLLPFGQREAAVACGLNSTGTVLLLCVFIPKTYLMAVAIVRDRNARSLPNHLNQNILTSSSDINYKSHQALNDSVFGTIIYKNSETGLSNPNFISGTSNIGSTESVTNLPPNLPAE